MTQNRNLKRRVRDRAAKTGESYTAALRHIRRPPSRGTAAAAPRSFTIARRSWLRTGIDVLDQDGAVQFTARWRPGLPTGTWTVKRDGRDVATLRTQALRPLRTAVTMDRYSFEFRRRLTLAREVQVEGGPFDGATLSGNLADLSFTLSHRGVAIAEASGKFLSLHDRHGLRMLVEDDPAAEALAMLLLIYLVIQKFNQS